MEKTTFVLPQKVQSQEVSRALFSVTATDLEKAARHPYITERSPVELG